MRCRLLKNLKFQKHETVNIILFFLLLTWGVVFMFLWKPKQELIITTRVDTIPGDSIPYAVEVKKPVPVFIVPGAPDGGQAD